MCSVLSLRPLQASKMGPFEKINGRFTCYLSSQEVTCYLFSGFRNSSLISSQMIIHLSLLLSFSKSRLWQGKIMHFYLCYIHIGVFYIIYEQSLWQELWWQDVNVYYVYWMCIRKKVSVKGSMSKRKKNSLSPRPYRE